MLRASLGNSKYPLDANHFFSVGQSFDEIFFILPVPHRDSPRFARLKIEAWFNCKLLINSQPKLFYPLCERRTTMLANDTLAQSDKQSTKGGTAASRGAALGRPFLVASF